MNNIFKNFIIFRLVCTIIDCFVILSVLWTFSNNIPDYKFLNNYKPQFQAKVYSRNGDLVADFSKEKRIFCTF